MGNPSNRAWWATGVQGLIAILFGVVVLAWPRVTLMTLIYLFAAYALVDGIFAVVGAIIHRKEDDRGWGGVVSGLVSIAVGLATFFWPSLTALLLLYLIAARAIIVGTLQVINVYQWRKQIEGDWIPVMGGLLSIAFGLIAFILPRSGALALLWLIGIYAIATGILWIVLALRARRWRAGVES
ncbi:MAG: HdeD family acid-resistance protein [Caldilineaceae bacterium]|nr:HdeD family acid-resistance protein [Caldilineaceae bacterium]